MSDPTETKTPATEAKDIVPLQRSSTRATRRLRIWLIAAIVFGFSWRLADPAAIAADADLYATPWAMLALLPVFALGAWTYEITGRGNIDVKADIVWGVLIALTAYLGLTVALALL
jgi:hypothetical protein